MRKNNFHEATSDEAYFWGIHNQAELDLMILKNGKRLGFEFKYADAPEMTKSMRQAVELLNLDSLSVIFPGKETFALAEKIQAVGFQIYFDQKSG